MFYLRILGEAAALAAGLAGAVVLTIFAGAVING